MNLAVLERMVAEGDVSREAFRFLLECRSECEWLDYKEALVLEQDAQLAGFARDVLALRNVGGGYIVVGVRDKTWEQVGLASTFPYDSKQLRDKVMRGTGVTLDVDVVVHSLSFDSTERRFAVILVRGSRKRTKRRHPSVVAKDFAAGTAYGLRRGEIYVRKGDSTVRISSQGELDDLLERLEEQADDDARHASGAPSPFAVEDGLYRLLDRGFDAFVGRKEFRTKVLDTLLGDPRIWIVNVHGPGGVGKSALVNWAAYKAMIGGRSRQFSSLTKETILTDEDTDIFTIPVFP